MPYKDPAARRAYAKRWKAERRKRYLDGRSCLACGSVEDLEFHHRDPDEKLSHRIWTWSTVRLEAELAKCDVLCGSCHDELHAEERRAPCGTNSAYRRGCRCDACRVEHTRVNRNYLLLRGESHAYS